MSNYAKALVPAVPGLVLLILGALVGNETLLAIGASLLGVSPVVWRVPNGKRVSSKRVRKGLPSRR